MTTELYVQRLPSPTAIRGALSPTTNIDLSSVVPGFRLTTDQFDIPMWDEPIMTPGEEHEIFVREVLRASATRAYVLLSPGYWDGWWRIDTQQAQLPSRSDVVGELTPVPNAQALATIPARELRIDDLMYVSGIPETSQVRVLDVIFMPDDGTGTSLLIRTRFGWFVWRREFAHVANF